MTTEEYVEVREALEQYIESLLRRRAAPASHWLTLYQFARLLLRELLEEAVTPAAAQEALCPAPPFRT